MIDRSLISTSYIAISPWDGISKIQPKVIEAGYAVVVDDDGFWGILTPQDIVQNNHSLVVDCIAPSPFISPNDTLRLALNLMETFKVNSIPCCGNGKFHGVITRSAITEHTLRCTEDLAEALDSVHLSNKKLEESERKFRHIVEIMGEGIAMVNNQEEFEFANAVAHNIFNQNSQRLKGHKVSSYLTKKEYKKFQEAAIIAQKKGKSTREIDILTKQGIVKTLLTTTTPKFDDYGIFIGTYCVFRDMTERKETLTALKEKTITLNERVKELNCLYNVSKLFENQNKSLDEIFKQLVKLIPKGFRYPNIACVKLTINAIEYKTPNCTDTPWKHTYSIISNGKQVGRITVGYTEKKQEIHEGPFHIAEINMLKAIAKQLGGVIERNENHEALIIKDLALASSLNAIAISDLEGNIKYINSAFLELWGYNNETEVIGMSLVKLWKNLDNVNEVRKQVIETGKHATTGIAKRKDGSFFHADTTSSLVYNEKNEPIAAIGVFVDITERMQAEDALIKSEKKYRLLVENLNEGVWQIDKFGYTVFVNSRMASILGYSVNEMIGKHLHNFMDDEGKSTAESNVKRRQSGISEQHDFEFIRKDKQKIYTILETSPIFDEFGVYQGAISGVLDITSRKNAELALQRSQRKLRAIIDNVPIVIFWKDINNRYLGCNRQFADYVGMTIEEVIGKTDADMPWGEYKENYIADDLEVFRTGKAKLNFEEQGGIVNGNPTWVRTSKVPLLDTNNSIVSVIGMFEDITKQKKVNEELEAYRNHLEQLVNERTFELKEAQRIGKIGSWKYNNITKELSWTDEVYRIFEKTPNTFTPTYSSFTNCLNKNYKAAFKNTYETSLKKKKPYTLEYQITTQSGKTKWLFQQGENHFNSEGQHTLTIGTVQDITHRKNLELELKQKDEEFELFFENINEVVLILDANGNTVYTNSIFEKIFDISITEQQKKPLAYFRNIHPEDISGFTDFIINQTDNPDSQKSSTIEFRVNQKNGSTLWLMVKAIPVFSNNKEFSRLIMLFSDITHQKMMHREILNAIVTAEEKERTRFAQDLHDGIGPLLSTSKLYLQWLKRPDTVSKKDNLLIQAENTIEEAIKCTREISHNLSPSLLTRYGLISALNSFVNRVKETQSLNINFTHNVKLRLQHQTETSIYRVVTECINNVIKHSDATVLSVDIKQLPKKLVISIKDNGEGFNLNEVLLKKQGLGIINMNNRIDTLEGKISINTAPGEGTFINIEIPINTSI